MAVRFHEASNIFPLVKDDEFTALIADSREHGQREPITLHQDGSILDGRNRYRACLKIGIEPKFRTWNGKGSPLEFVLSLNLHRRHLTASQRGGRGGRLLPPNLGEAKGESADKAASLVQVAHGYISLAKKLKEEYPDLFRKVRAGELTITDAKYFMGENRREQMRRENRELVRSTRPLPLKYQTIVIDPPWPYDNSRIHNPRVASLPYASLSVDQIAALPVWDLAEENAHLYLWTSNLFLPKSFALLEAWGFRYATLLTWVKPRAVISPYFNSKTEHVLFGVRGSLTLGRRDATTVISGDRPKRHSTKPDTFYELVESYSPGPWIDLFARRSRPGWAIWGAEVGKRVA